MMTTSSEETLIRIIIENLPKLIIPVVGFIILFLLIRRINIEKERRDRQIVMPIIATGLCIIFVVCGTVFLYKHNPATLYGIFMVVFNAMSSKLGNGPVVPRYSGGFIVFVNISMFALFLPIKYVLCRVLDWLADKYYLLFNESAADYYAYNTAFARWFVRDNWRGFQRLFAVLSWVSVLVGGLLLGASWLYEARTRVAVIFFPFVLVIICNEISEALNGFTKEEYENYIGGDDTVIAGKIGNYQLILDIYERLQEHNLLASQRGNDFAAKQGVTDYIAELEKSDNQVDQLAGHFFHQQNSDRTPLDIDSMQGSVMMLHNESVVFSNPFYRDLSKYVLLPVVDALIKGNRCLFLIGEKDIADDVISWINEMLEEYAKVSGIWRTSILDHDEPDCEIGILDFSSLYDLEVQEANRLFFQTVAVCVLVECSNMVSAAQIALGVVVDELNHQDTPPVYCVIDRNADGIVDTFSHVLKTNITNVVASPIPHCVYTSAIWDANGDYQRQKWFKKETRFLGNVMELAAIAIKNQIPKVTILGGKNVPTRDIEWISGQYYSQIADYTHLVKQQASIKQHFIFEPNLWNMQKKHEQFLIVEDQYCNMFEALRLFLSRGEQQAFINIMSGSYLLRDYMHYNRQIFISDAKAVPTIIPDYARTERNTILKLIMRMAVEKIPEHEIVEELLLLDIERGGEWSVQKNLEELICRYTSIEGKEIVKPEKGAIESESPISESGLFYYIERDVFDKCFSTTLKNAYFVTEEQRLSSEYIDAKMFGMITQCILPGQFIVLSGKYYQVESINPEYGVLLRRASDRYTRRCEYRQIRHYIFNKDDEFVPISTRKMMDIIFAVERRNFRVISDGYLDMSSYHDLKSAKVIDFSENQFGDDSRKGGDVGVKTLGALKSIERSYRNKNVLRITLPDFDVNMRMTFAMLLQEMFRTIYPGNWQYLAVLSPKAENVDGMLKYLNYDVEGFPCGENDILVVEDSDIDMGLLESIENNFSRFMELMTDYLTWHFEQLSESPQVDPVKMKDFSIFEIIKSQKNAKKKKSRSKLFSRLKKLSDAFKSKFSRKKDDSTEGEDGNNDGKNSGSEGIDGTIEKIKGTEKDTTSSEETSKTNEDSGNGDDNITSGETEGVHTTGEEQDARATIEFVNGEFKFIPPEPAIVEDLKLFSYGDASVSDCDGDNEDKESSKQTDDTLELEKKTDDNSAETESEDNDEAIDDVIDIPEWDAPDDWKDLNGRDELDDLPKADFLDGDGTDDEFRAVEGILDSFDNVRGLLRLPQTRYRKYCFLKFGFDEIDSSMALKEIKGYLTARGYGVTGFETTSDKKRIDPDDARIELTDNALTNARNSDSGDFAFLDDNVDEENRIYCDFCGMPLTGVSYEELRDGRIRCNDCSATAIETVEEFRRLFKRCFEQMQSCYKIHFDRSISVKMMDAKSIAKANRAVFRPTRKYDSRVVGYAQHINKKSFNLNIENGSPRLSSIETMIHELTHIWQYIKWDDKVYIKVHGRFWNLIRTTVYEGMAVWSATQYLYVIGEIAYAEMQETLMEMRLESMADNILYELSRWRGDTDSIIKVTEFMWTLVDPYAFGYYLYKQQFPLIKNMDVPRRTPFNQIPPFDEVMSRDFFGCIYFFIIDYVDRKKNAKEQNR